MDRVPSLSDLPCVCTILRKASRAVSRVYDASLATVGMTAPQLSILQAIQKRNGVALSRLTEDMVMDRSSLYRALTPMMSAGWVRVRDAEPGRAKHVVLTEAGHEALAAASAHWDAAQRRFVDALGAGRWGEISQALMILVEVGGDLAH